MLIDGDERWWAGSSQGWKVENGPGIARSWMRRALAAWSIGERGVTSGGEECGFPAAW